MKSILDEGRMEETAEMIGSTSAWDQLRAYNARCLMSGKWDAFMGLVITINSTCIGVEQTLVLEGGDTRPLQVMEHFFLIIYIVEFSMNILEGGFRPLLSDGWLQLDAFLVVLGLFTTWIMGPLLGGMEGANPLMALRMIRLLRLARMVRLLHTFKGLWTLVQGFISSLGTMCYTTLLLVLVLYAYACLGMELIRNHDAYGVDEKFTAIVDEYFTNLPRIMLTLLQFVAMDSVSTFYVPLCVYDGWLVFYFFSIILTVAMVFMNIVTALIVNTAFEAEKVDKEMKKTYESSIKRGVTESLGQMFTLLDDDCTGTISLDEVKNSPPEAQELLCELAEVETVEDVFNEIDLDFSGEISLEEFCDGILDIVNSDCPKEIRHVEKHFARLFALLTRIELKVDEKFGAGQPLQSKVETRLENIDLKLDRIIGCPRNGEDVDGKEEKMRMSGLQTAEGSRKDLGVAADSRILVREQLLSELANICAGAEQKLRHCAAAGTVTLIPAGTLESEGLLKSFPLPANSPSAPTAHATFEHSALGVSRRGLQDPELQPMNEGSWTEPLGEDNQLRTSSVKKLRPKTRKPKSKAENASMESVDEMGTLVEEGPLQSRLDGFDDLTGRTYSSPEDDLGTSQLSSPDATWS